MFGVAPNPVDGGKNWTVLIASPQPDPDDDADDPALTVVAFTEDVDLGDVSEKEIRFDLYEDSEENPHAIYAGVALHRHGDGDECGECETFTAESGRTHVDDIPDDLYELVEDAMEMEIHAWGDEPVDASPVHVSDLEPDDPEPRGFY